MIGSLGQFASTTSSNAEIITQVAIKKWYKIYNHQ